MTTWQPESRSSTADIEIIRRNVLFYLFPKTEKGREWLCKNPLVNSSQNLFTLEVEFREDLMLSAERDHIEVDVL